MAPRKERELKSSYVLGRFRTERAVPTANTDVNKTDKEGDIIRNGSYEYIVVNDSGTLKWARQALDVGW